MAEKSTSIPALFRRVPLAVWVFIAAFLCQFVVLNFIADSRHFLPNGDDMKFYNDWALKLRGEMPWRAGEPNAPGTAYYGLPGYAYALAGLYSLSGGYDHWYSPYLVGQLQAGFHALTAVFLFLLARRVFGGTGAEENKRGIIVGALAAAAWVAFTPAQVFSAILMPTSWVVCAFWGLVYWLVRTHESGRVSWWRPWLLMGLLMGFFAMIVATILMLTPLVIAAIVLTLGRGRALKSRVLPVAGAVAVLVGGLYTGCSPAWIHNHFIAKDPVLLSAHDGLNFYLGNHATATGYTKIPTGLRASQDGLLRDSLSIPEKEAGHPLRRSEVSAYWKKKGQTYIRENPLAWMKLLGVKFANFWNAYQYDDLAILKLLRDENAVAPGLRFGFAAALALPALFLCAWRWPRSRWVIAASLLHMVGLMPVFITERYRLAAAPGLLLIGVGGLWLLWESIATRAWRIVAVYLVMLAGSVWFVTRPQTDVGLWSLDFYKAGLRATDGAQAARALGKTALADAYLANAHRNLETASAYVPNNTEIAFALGNVWLLREDHERASLCYARALDLSRSTGRLHDGALNNLGIIAIQRKRWTEAESYLLASLQVETDDAKTWFLLAQARKELGNHAGSQQAIGRALELKPGNPDLVSFQQSLKETPKP